MEHKAILTTGRFLVAAMLAAACSLGQQRTASISGEVTDENKAPIAGARVLYNSVRAVSRGPLGEPRWSGPLVRSSVLSALDGSFIITGLPAATYYICVIGTAPEHLKSCAWGRPVRVVRLKAGDSVSGVALTVPSGTILKLTVQDPKGRIAAGAKFIPGVFSASGAYGRFELKSSTATQLNYALAVPKQASFVLMLSTQLDIVDASGAPVQVGKPGPVISSGQQAELPITIQVR